MRFLPGLFLLGVVVRLHGQTICPPTPAYSICDISFDVPASTPNAEVNAEFRGPSHRTFLLRVFRVGSNRMVVRFSPFEPGTWDVRISSTIEALNDKALQFTATPSDSQGWIEVANVNHFRYTGGNRLGHLWLGDTMPEGLDFGAFQRWVNARAAAGVNHVRIKAPNSIDERRLDDLDARLGYVNGRGMIGDLVLTPPDGGRPQRRAFFEYVVARYAARNITWIMLDQFEKYEHVHDLLAELSSYLDEDSFHHPRTVGAAGTSGTFGDEKWLSYRWYGPVNWAVSAVEDQIYPNPAVSQVRGNSPDNFRHQLWNAAMSGSYPEAAGADATELSYMKVWKDLYAETRHWDEEPFFDVDGARGVSLPDTEFILYVEKPGTVNVNLRTKHKWEGEWINPISGEHIELKKIWEDSFSGEPPDSSHDWVLHIYREGYRESLKSFRFEARPTELQEIEADPAKAPFEIAQPSGDSLPLDKPTPFAVHLKKQTHATSMMIYLWIGEVMADEEGYRILGTGASGTMSVPPAIVHHHPATLHLRLYGLNAYGKLYSLDQNYGLTH